MRGSREEDITITDHHEKRTQLSPDNTSPDQRVIRERKEPSDIQTYS